MLINQILLQLTLENVFFYSFIKFENASISRKIKNKKQLKIPVEGRRLICTSRYEKKVCNFDEEFHRFFETFLYYHLICMDSANGDPT